jgi:glycosyltransferase involved in cell wall biosynthesis
MVLQRPLHVLHVIAQLLPGGSERQCLRYVQRLDPRRVRCSLVTWHIEDAVLVPQYQQAGCPVYPLNRWRARGLPFLKDLFRLARRLNPDIVHAWAQAGGYWGPYIAKFCLHRPLVLFVGFDPYVMPQWRRLANDILWRFVDKFLINSERTRDRFVRLTRTALQRTEVQYNGLDRARFLPPNQHELRCRTRSQLGLSDEHQVITIIGRLRPEKNHLLLFRAAEHLRTEFPELRVLVVGEGDLEPSLRQWVTEHGTEQTIRFLGRREDVPDLLAAADLHVLCSDHEGMPHSVEEAMAAGRPVVSTNVGGVRALLRNGMEGFLVEPGDQAGLTVGIRSLLTDPELAATMGRRAAQRLSREHDIAYVINRLMDIYEELDAHRRHRLGMGDR